MGKRFSYTQSQLLYGRSEDQESKNLKKEILTTAKNKGLSLSNYLIALHKKCSDQIKPIY